VSVQFGFPITILQFVNMALIFKHMILIFFVVQITHAHTFLCWLIIHVHCNFYSWCYNV